MPQIRIFNPAYTPRSFFAGGASEKGGTVARHHRRHHHRRSRRNPFGLGGGVIKDAGYNAAGALASLFLVNTFGGSFNSGWTGVAATGVAAVASSFAGKFVGGARAAEEVLKGGLTATIIRAIHQAGFLTNVGLSGYVRSYFAVPTASDAYGRVTGSPYPVPALPGKGGAMGAVRYASRYAGRFN